MLKLGGSTDPLPWPRMNSKTFCAIAVLCIGCSARTSRFSLVEVVGEVSQADRLWQERHVHGLDAVLGALTFEDAEVGRHPDIQWRRARAVMAKGVAAVEREAALDSYGEARAIALGCLEESQAFRMRRAEWGWVDAIQFIPPRRAVCASMLGLAWVRWLGEIGPAASSSDLEVLDALLAWAVRQPQPRAQEYAQWSQALLDAMRQPWDGRDLGRAQDAFQSLRVQAEVSPVMLEADQLRWVCADMVLPTCADLRSRLEQRVPLAADTQNAVARALAATGPEGAEQTLD